MVFPDANIVAKLFKMDRDATRFLGLLSDDWFCHLTYPTVGNPLLHHTAPVIAMLRKSIASYLPCDDGEQEGTPFPLLLDNSTQFESEVDILSCIGAESIEDLNCLDTGLSSAIHESQRSNDPERFQASSVQTTFPIFRKVYALQRQLMDATCR